jgi:hypothetical protein
MVSHGRAGRADEFDGAASGSDLLAPHQALCQADPHLVYPGDQILLLMASNDYTDNIIIHLVLARN